MVDNSGKWDAEEDVQAFVRRRHAGRERDADGAPGGGMGALDRPFLLATARAWWAAKMPNQIARAVTIKGDGRVDVAWSDADESGNYTLPVNFLQDVAALTKPTPPASVSGEVVTDRLEVEAAIARIRAEPRTGSTVVKSRFDKNDVNTVVNACARLLAAAPEAATPSAVGGVDRLREAARAIANQIRSDHALLPLSWGEFTKAEQGRYLRQATAALATGETSRDGETGK